MKDLSVFTAHLIDSIPIYNHSMEWKKTDKHIRGVLLKDILDKAGIEVSSPKILSEFYITCKGSDNYKVVFPWNEIFNSAIVEQVSVVTESKDKQMNK